MRLLQCDDAGRCSLTDDFVADNAPPYAILSHTWGPDEVVYADLANTPAAWQHKAGYDKIKFCAEQVEQHGLRYFWVDTCCIDKSNNIELQTAINSMFRWYRDAKRCYVYLADVSSAADTDARDNVAPWEGAFRKSRWFTRGWILQELLAPTSVDFYSKEGVWLGDKQSLRPAIRDITGIPASALNGTPLSDFPVSEREAWVRNRQTKYPEDLAYALLGIFDVHMPLIYGEGRDNAQKRLREEIQKVVKGTRANNFSVTFSLSDVPETQHFVAREGELAEIRSSLSSDGSRRVIVLHGLGGIGKTQIAITYAKRYRDEYSAVFWLNIKDEASIQQSFIKVATQIMQQYPDASLLSAEGKRQSHEETIEAVKAWLSLSNNTRWLLIYDNLDNPRLTNSAEGAGIDIHQFLPTAYQGSIIITTRSSQVDLGYMIRIRKLVSIENNVDARSLVRELDGLPLALATAGAYLKRVSIGFDGYLRLYKESWARLHANTPGLGSYQDRTLCSTWQLSYDQLRRHNPLAGHLLRWWAYFDNEDIWFELLQADEDDRPAWVYELNDELSFNDAMGTLHDYGLVDQHTGTPGLTESRGYSIHSCVHNWTIHMLNQTWDVDLARFTIGCVASLVPSRDSSQFWQLQRRLLSHAVRCYATIRDSDHDIPWAFHSLGDLYSDQGKMAEAEAMMDEAEAMYQRALQGKEKAWGPDHTSTLDTVNNLAVLYSDQGRMDEAEAMYQRALQGYEKALGADIFVRYRPALNTMQNLANLRAHQGQRIAARELYMKAYGGLELLLGPQNLTVQRLRDTVLHLERSDGKSSNCSCTLRPYIKGAAWNKAMFWKCEMEAH
ncbi:uncharacterized protein PG986_004608 [Apiospora aurea]|uniref:HET-domain-containing protein n=1 Tax=Apiospora aurea TaxID=335848 RepID=A0ABR1QPN7_9PEZI